MAEQIKFSPQGFSDSAIFQLSSAQWIQFKLNTERRDTSDDENRPYSNV